MANQTGIASILANLLTIAGLEESCESSTDPTKVIGFDKLFTAYSATLNSNSPPSNKTFQDDVLSYYSGGAQLNAGTIKSLAGQIAGDLAGWYGTEYDEVYNGIVILTPNGFDDEIVFVYHYYDVTSRRISGIYNDFPERFAHFDQSTDSSCNSISKLPWISFYGPPVTQVAGQYKWPRYQLSQIGDILKYQFIQYDYTCTCGTGCLLCVQVNCTVPGGGSGSIKEIPKANVNVSVGSDPPFISCITDDTGLCCVDITAGTYNVEVDAPGYGSATKSVDVTCPGTTTVTIDFNLDASLQCCQCVESPKNVNMTVGAGCAAEPQFVGQDCVIVWGKTPSIYSSILPAYSYLSSTVFTDPTSGDKYQWLLVCDAANTRYTLTRAYQSFFGNPPPFLDIARMTYLIGAAGNTCSPTWLMSNGAIYAGGQLACQGATGVILSGTL